MEPLNGALSAKSVLGICPETTTGEEKVLIRNKTHKVKVRESKVGGLC